VERCARDGFCAQDRLVGRATSFRWVIANSCTFKLSVHRQNRCVKVDDHGASRFEERLPQLVVQTDEGIELL